MRRDVCFYDGGKQMEGINGLYIHFGRYERPAVSVT